MAPDDQTTAAGGSAPDGAEPLDIVDSHVHLLPGRLGAKVRSWFEAAMGKELVYPNDHGVIRERLADAGIRMAWTLPYAHKPGVAEGLNHASARTAGESGAALVVIGGATVHPADDAPELIVRRAVEDLGLRVLKLHCSVGDFPADDPRLDAMWAYVSAVAVPVVVHVGHSVNGHTDADELVAVDTVARRFPEATIVIAHCGHHAVDAALDLVERHPGVHADLTPVVRQHVAIDPARVASCARKLMFGTDAPNTALTAESGVAWLRGLGLDDAALRAVAGGTARRLLAATPQF